jgi:transcriptional regulator with XRE-family HTH domain
MLEQRQEGDNKVVTLRTSRAFERGSAPDVQNLKISEIIVNPEIRSRVDSDRNRKCVKDYAKLIQEGHQFDPIIVFRDAQDQILLSAGFTRLQAYKSIGETTIPAEVRQGERRDAILCSVSSDKHGAPCTQLDNRRKVMLLMSDPEWSQWVDREIARCCGISNSTVHQLKLELRSLSVRIEQIDDQIAQSFGVDVATLKRAVELNNNADEPRKAQRNGKPYTINTQKIGRNNNKSSVNEETLGGETELSQPLLESGSAQKDGDRALDANNNGTTSSIVKEQRVDGVDGKEITQDESSVLGENHNVHTVESAPLISSPIVKALGGEQEPTVESGERELDSKEAERDDELKTGWAFGSNTIEEDEAIALGKSTAFEDIVTALTTVIDLLPRLEARGIRGSSRDCKLSLSNISYPHG